MIVALYILIALLLVGALLYFLHRRDLELHGSQPQEPEAASAPQDGEECCGMHITCEKDSLLAAVSADIVYYDDEELDRYRGKDPLTYTPEQTEEFRDVLLTLLPDDIAGWARSIQLRGIQLPPEVKDELIMIVAEERQKRTSEPHNA